MYHALCFSGGAIRGFLHLGALHELKIQNKLDIKEVSGNSIGSLCAAIVAMNIDLESVISLLFELEINVVDRIDLLNFLQTKAIYSSDKLKNLCQQIISLKYNYNITFKELFTDTGIKLNINTTDVDNYTETIFNYINYPDVYILDAIIASMSIPLIFPPVVIGEKRYVDGFLINDIPYEILEDQENILILYINRTLPDCHNENLYDYIFKLLNCICSKKCPEIKNPNKTVFLNTECADNNILSLDLDKKINLFYHGKKLIKNFLQK